MKLKVISALATALTLSSAQADVLGVYIGGQVWDSQASGIFGESGHQIDFNLKDEKQGSYFLAVEHPVPFIPNARIASTTLDTMGTTTLKQDIEFANQEFFTGSVVNSGFDVSYVDYTLYYELFDNGLLSFDVGITGRDFQGDISVSSTDSSGGSTSTVEGKLNTDEIIPMLYAYTNVGLPFTGFNLFAEGNFLSLKDHTLHDYQAGISYELVDNLAVDVNLTLGYRVVSLELEDIDNLYSDLEFKGVFAGAVIHF